MGQIKGIREKEKKGAADLRTWEMLYIALFCENGTGKSVKKGQNKIFKKVCIFACLFFYTML